jgi:uncharacterized membrane protein YbhN (UPF0104 family)
VLSSSGRTRTIVLIVLAAALTAATVLLIGRAAHYAELLHELRAASPGWLVVCGLGEIGAYAGYIAAYQAIAELSGGPRLPAVVVMRVVGLSFGAFSVATAIGGLSVDFWALRQAGEPAALAGARVIALETMRWAVLGVATCLAAVVILVGLDHGPSWVACVAWLVLVPACFAGGLFVSTPGRRQKFRPDSGGVLRRALGVAVVALVYLRGLRRAPAGVRTRALTGAAVFWAGELLCAWAALRSFGVTVGLAPLLVGYTTGYASTVLPLPVGGSGGVDAAMTGGFVLAGAPLSVALLAAVTFRFFSFWLPAIAALVSVVTMRGLRDRLHEIAAERQ